MWPRESIQKLRFWFHIEFQSGLGWPVSAWLHFWAVTGALLVGYSLPQPLIGPSILIFWEKASEGIEATQIWREIHYVYCMGESDGLPGPAEVDSNKTIHREKRP